MAFMIFYAWQSDIDRCLCKDVIREALDAAAAELTEELGIDIVIDQDTQDVPGSPSIPDTILEKIAAAEAVVADLTLTHTSDKQIDPKKRGSNPNVMLEYGYGLRGGDHNLLGVVNTAFGEPEQLPFDLRARRCVTYHAAKDSDRVRAQKRLAEQFTDELRAIMQTAGAERSGESHADWTVHELFQHLLNASMDAVDIARRIEDCARLGQLACWGRKYSVNPPHENPHPLRPIPPEHWDNYSIEATLCAYSEDAAACCTEMRNPRNWQKHGQTDTFQDLRVNRAQAKKLWADQ